MHSLAHLSYLHPAAAARRQLPVQRGGGPAQPGHAEPTAGRGVRHGLPAAEAGCGSTHSGPPRRVCTFHSRGEALLCKLHMVFICIQEVQAMSNLRS